MTSKPLFLNARATGLAALGTLCLIGASFANGPAVAQSGRAPNDASFTYSFPTLVSGLNNPIFLTHANDDRLFVAERGGVIKIIRNGAVSPTPFLNISARVLSENYVEEGLLGLAFEPDFATTSRFYVYYTNSAGNQVLSRFTANGDVADPNSETIILPVSHPGNQNHNGGWIAFGPGSFLYVAIGDGGGGGDPDCTGEDPSQLRGKILRIKVIGEATYTSPPENLFGVTAVTQRPEVWAIGLRNPWRNSFDRDTGDLWIGDVGQGALEEISLMPAGTAAGANFGWSRYEGASTYSSGCTNKSGKVALGPVFDYPHAPTGGSSVTGGYVYRGTQTPGAQGFYYFADYSSRRMWATYRDTATTRKTVVVSNNIGVSPSSFGEGPDGELYVVDFGGSIRRLQIADNSVQPTPSGPLDKKVLLPAIVKK